MVSLPTIVGLVHSGPEPTRLVVLVSGSGTNLQALIDACQDPSYGARIVAVGADREDIEALARAERAGIETFVVLRQDFESRELWDSALAEATAQFSPQLVVLAGFMRLVGKAFLSAFGGITINTHPALSPAFPGTNSVSDALEYGVKVTGATLFIVDAGVDTGAIINQVPVAVEANDTVESLHDRIKTAERAMLVEAVRRMVQGGWEVDNRQVRLK